MKNLYVRLIPATAALAAIFCSLASLQAYAESGRHGAHFHGAAELTLAMEGSNLEVSFSSPAISVLGFEHKASSPAQLTAVDDARGRLSDTTSLFAFSGTVCALQSATVDMSSVTSSRPHQNPEHDAHETHSDADSHSDIHAHYKYTCTDGKQLQSLRVGNAALPFNLQKISAMWVLEDAQGATVLTATKQIIKFNEAHND